MNAAVMPGGEATQTEDGSKKKKDKKKNKKSK